MASKAEVRLHDVGQGKAALVGTLRNQMKRVYDIAALHISEEERDSMSPPAPQFIMMERPDVVALLHAMADCAWTNGWRPRGLSSVVANTVTNYKLPPDEGPTDAKKKR